MRRFFIRHGKLGWLAGYDPAGATEEIHLGELARGPLCRYSGNLATRGGSDSEEELSGSEEQGWLSQTMNHEIAVSVVSESSASSIQDVLAGDLVPFSFPGSRVRWNKRAIKKTGSSRVEKDGQSETPREERKSRFEAKETPCVYWILATAKE